MVYASWRHALVTLGIAATPFIFLLFFARFTNVTLHILLSDLFVSSVRLLAAYVISVILAWIAGALLYRGRRAIIALPAADVLQSFPTFAALPLAAYVWGAGNATVIFFLVVTIIWPIFFSIVSSLKLIRHDWDEAVRIAGLGGWAYVRYFLLPVSLPGVITGSIIGLGEGWEALVATEIILGSRVGLGSFFSGYSGNSAITSLGILGLLLFIFSLNSIVWLPLLHRSHARIEE